MDVVMPQLGETVAEGKIATWFKAVGDTVAEGEGLFEIETDKVTMEVQALGAGVVSEIRVKTGETVPVGTVVAVIGGAAAAGAAAPAGTANGATPPKPAAAPEGFGPYSEMCTPLDRFGPAEAGGVRMTPLARRLIAQQGLDVATVAAAAKARGATRIGKRDLAPDLAPAAPASAAPAPAARAPARPAVAARPGTRVPMNAMRRQTGQRLQQSWTTIPHVFQATEIEFHAVDAVRAARKEAFRERHGAALTYLPFIARAVCLAIGDFPQVNARLDGEALEIASEVNLGIAVDLSHNGLVVPVIRNADELTVAGLAKAIARLVEKARGGGLSPDDFAGGTYTISNNGSFGTLFTAPIINPPQVAILSTDAVKRKPVVVETAGGEAIAVRPVAVVAQSFDHRAFDGAYSAAFLARLKEIIETRDWAAEVG